MSAMHILWIAFNLTGACLGACISSFMVYVRRKQLRGADELIADDKKNYDQVWDSTLSSNHPGILQVIQSLKAVVATWKEEFDIFKLGGVPARLSTERSLTDAVVKTMVRVSRMATVSSAHTGRPRQQVS